MSLPLASPTTLSDSLMNLQMKPLEHAQLHSMLLLQNRLNVRVNSTWRRANNAWLRAAWIESAELMEHVGWKWWKKQEPNLVQAQIELVDIWHFMLSEWLQNTPEDENEYDSAGLLISVLYDPEKGGPKMRETAFKEDDLRKLIDAFANLCSSDIFNVIVFERIMSLCEMDWDQLFRMYVQKNVLNMFRQDHGYKEGTYQKTWVLDGEPAEDNVVLERLMTESGGTIDLDVLAVRLAVEYSKVPPKQ